MASAPFICGRCARATRTRALPLAALSQQRRHLSQSLPLSLPAANAANPSSPNPTEHAHSKPPSEPRRPPDPDPEPGPMARRLEQATEDALLTGGRAGRRAIEEAGFDEELKAKLLDKVASAKFNVEHSSALSQAGITSRIPDSAGLGTRAIAASQAWTGEETTEDAVLRMLDDAKKPLAPGLRGKPRMPDLKPVDMRLRREAPVSRGQRAAGARDKAHAYGGLGMKDSGLSVEEREAVKREFRERFAPGARAMPNTVSGLAALANERIEDAIARGQFKNIPRGKGVERDTRADNPFIDTTEYIMNKMIKRQEIVPPWIEKQQELVKAAHTFRARLRNDWKRHAARMIASRGGTLDEQIARATAYARAEEAHNPRRRNVDQISVPTNSTDDVIMLQRSSPQPPSPTQPAPSQPDEAQVHTPPPQQQPSQPFRDPTWEASELAYHTLAIANLNTLTRSYNLMAPDLAKKPYFSLDRELRNCFADVAPEVAGEIRIRATKPARSLVDAPFGGARRGAAGRGLFAGEGFGLGGGARVYERREGKYGLKEWWRDLWKREGQEGEKKVDGTGG
ncbi:DnaJ homologue subfamily C member 28 conserved domain-containing protein [Madurella fahalii]|uniref:DnaJ homologue subfamily C member 28 conserved domain-containing protein n=1 Tax=Madurella fahalii TaxID=1157608 RepID=A0ABQ0G4J2_9PEZI